MSARLSQVSVLFVLACTSSTPGARPHDMSAARHEQSARDDDHAAAVHVGQYDPLRTATRTECRPNPPRPSICWTAVENPTDAHLRAAEQHRRRAADHRAASAALRDAEARACVGIADGDRDISPFDRVEDIARVERLTEVVSPKLAIRRTVGAIVTFRARPAMTSEWLQRVVDCHIARNAALGHVNPEMPNCPLVPKGVVARVTSTGNGFAIAIRSDDPAVAREVLDRARRSLRNDSQAVTTRTRP